MWSFYSNTWQMAPKLHSVKVLSRRVYLSSQIHSKLCWQPSKVPITALLLALEGLRPSSSCQLQTVRVRVVSVWPVRGPGPVPPQCWLVRLWWWGDGEVCSKTELRHLTSPRPRPRLLPGLAAHCLNGGLNCLVSSKPTLSNTQNFQLTTRR